MKLQLLFAKCIDNFLVTPLRCTAAQQHYFEKAKNLTGSVTDFGSKIYIQTCDLKRAKQGLVLSSEVLSGSVIPNRNTFWKTRLHNSGLT